MKTTTQSKHQGDQFWELSERLLLESLILHAVGQRHDGRGHFGHICELLTMQEKELRSILYQSNIKEARSAFSRFADKGSDTTRNIVSAGLVQRLHLWTEPRNVALTAATDIEIPSLSEDLFTFYVVMPTHRQELKTISVLAFNWALDLALNQSFQHPLMLLLDEFTNFGYIAGMDSKLTTIGHRNTPVMLGIQDACQLKLVYKDEADVFRTQPGTQIYFRPRDLTVAKDLSESLGLTTAADCETTAAGQIVINKVQRPLLRADELRTLDFGKAIVFLPRTRPLKIDHYLPADYMSLILPPPVRQPVSVKEGLTVLDKDTAAQTTISANPAEPGSKDLSENFPYTNSREQHKATSELVWLEICRLEKLASELRAQGRFDEASTHSANAEIGRQVYEQALKEMQTFNPQNAYVNLSEKSFDANNMPGA